MYWKQQSWTFSLFFPQPDKQNVSVFFQYNCDLGVNYPYHIKIGETTTDGPEDRAGFYRLHL